MEMLNEELHLGLDFVSWVYKASKCLRKLVLLQLV
jgi:hypothetical protein